MGDRLYFYIVDLPDGINEMVTPCFDGYSIYFDSNLDEQGRMKALEHAMEHIARRDFENENVQEIESRAH